MNGHTEAVDILGDVSTELKPMEKHVKAVVESMGCSRYIYRACPEQQIAEEGPEKHSRQEAEKLKVQQAEYHCCKPHGHMSVYAGARSYHPLYGASETQLLAKACKDTYYYNIYNEATYGLGVKHGGCR